MMKLVLSIALVCGTTACAVSTDSASDESDPAVSQATSDLSSKPTPQITCPGNLAHPPCCEVSDDDPHVCVVFRVCEAGGWICP